jgi:hypothetical protein
LGWPDVSGKPFVEFTSVSQDENGDGIERPIGKGFLFGEDEKGFTIVCTSAAEDGWMSPLSLTRVKKPDARYQCTFKHREIALNDAVDALVAPLRGMTTQEQRMRLFGGRKMSHYASVFVLARCCARIGRKDLAERLDAELLNLGYLSRSSDAPAGHSPFRNTVESEIAFPLIWHAVEEFGDTSLSRPELLAHFERIQRDFPASHLHGLVSDTVEMLRMRVKQCGARRRGVVLKLQKLPNYRRRGWVISANHTISTGLPPTDRTRARRFAE